MTKIVAGALSGLVLFLQVGAFLAWGYDVPPSNVIIKPGQVISGGCSMCTNPIAVNNISAYDINVTITVSSASKGYGTILAVIPKNYSGSWDLGNSPLYSVSVKLPNSTSTSQSCEGCTYTIWNVTTYNTAGKDYPFLTRKQ